MELSNKKILLSGIIIGILFSLIVDIVVYMVDKPTKKQQIITQVPDYNHNTFTINYATIVLDDKGNWIIRVEHEPTVRKEN